MNVASLELSKKLYEISEHTWLGDGDHKPEYKAAPIYTLGYLLRKLQGSRPEIYTESRHARGCSCKTLHRTLPTKHFTKEHPCQRKQ